MWAIDPSAAGVDAGEIPTGAVMGRNDFGNNAYGGPCPPPGHGTHHYNFVLSAVAALVELNPGASIEDLRAAMGDQVLAQATLTGTYER